MKFEKLIVVRNVIYKWINSLALLVITNIKLIDKYLVNLENFEFMDMSYKIKNQDKYERRKRYKNENSNNKERK